MSQNDETTLSKLSNFIEFCAVRYLMGAIVGVFCVYYLTKGKDINCFLCGFESRDRLLIYIALGLFYCYVASAPILVFHACRWSIEDKSKYKNKKFRCFFISFPLFVPITQYYLTFKTWKNPNKNFLFNKKVNDARSKAQEDKKEETIKSYRDLRNHGNSFFILFLEILLFFILNLLHDFNIIASFVLILAWILPAVLVYFVGTFLEFEFANNGENNKHTPNNSNTKSKKTRKSIRKLLSKILLRINKKTKKETIKLTKRKKFRKM